LIELEIDKKIFWFWFGWLAAGTLSMCLFYRPLFDSFWGSLAGIFWFAAVICPPLAALAELIFNKWRLEDGRRPLILLAALAVFFFAFYAAFSWHKHDNFATGYDLAIFDQAIWHMSRFELPSSSVRNVPLVFADHFDPAIAIAVPFYWLFDNVKMLLFFQVLVLVVPVFIFYAWGRYFSIRPMYLIFLSLYYLTSACVQGIPNFDFHETALAPMFIIAAFYFLSRQKWFLYSLSIILLVLVKEEFALLAAAIGLFAIFKERQPRIGAATVVLSAGFFAVLAGVIMPAINFSGSGYVYSQLFYGFENGFLGGIGYYFADPSRIAAVFSMLPDKWWNIVFYLVPLAFPVVFQPAAAVLFLPALVQRILSSYIYLSYPRYYYNIVFPVLGLAVFAYFLKKPPVHIFSNLQKKISKFGFSIIGAIVMLPLAANLVYSINYSYLFDPADNWRSVSDPKAADKKFLLDAVPGGASVAAAQIFLPHLSHRKNLYILPRIGDAQFVVIHYCESDICNYWPMGKEDIGRLQSYLADNGHYVARVKNDAGIVFERTGEYSQALKNENSGFCRKIIEGAKLEDMHRGYLGKNCDY
jgi:uncharacterized membrane protein